MPESENQQPLDPTLAAAMERLDTLVDGFESYPDPLVQEQVVALLQTVDAIHRVGLTRLAAYLDNAGGVVREQVLGDPNLRLLLELYDLLPDGPPTPAVGFVALDDIQVIPAPRRAWLPAARLTELSGNALLPLLLDETRILLAGVGDEVYAYRSSCGLSPLPLDAAYRQDNAVICPWHGCRYDLASGRRLDGEGAGLSSLPVDVSDGVVRVLLESQPAPRPVGSG
jgi:nitrite reductase/ring-hydroxylating ferredoxin subunit